MDYNFNIWYESKDPIFEEICLQSRIPKKWIYFKYVKEYKNSIIKPINRYVEALVPPPKLISIKNNLVTLQQNNHAAFFLLSENNIFYNVDRPWMRQYYNTNFSPKIPENCFPGTYKFYSPWYIDGDIKINYLPSEQWSPFFIYPSSFFHKKIDLNQIYIEPDFISFHFKKYGPHIDRPGFGKILKDNPMFDIVFECNDIMLDRIKEFYEQNKFLSI